MARGFVGRLLVVGTPIGNLGDLTPRAADALRTADLVVAEDTRMAARLLAQVGASTRTMSFNEHNAAVVARYYAENAIHSDQAMAMDHRGRAAISKENEIVSSVTARLIGASLTLSALN